MTRVIIEHHNGTAPIEGFERIEEINEPRQTLRVWHEDSDERKAYNDYHGARIIKVEP